MQALNDLDLNRELGELCIKFGGSPRCIPSLIEILGGILAAIKCSVRTPRR